MNPATLLPLIFTLLISSLAVAQNTSDVADTPNRRGSVNNETLMSQFLNMDKDGDGKLTIDEAQGQLKTSFNRNDTNKDGYLARSELQSLALRLSAGRNRGARANQTTKAPPTMSDEELLKLAPEGVTVIPDIAYRAGNKAWKLDLAMPTQASDTPRHHLHPWWRLDPRR